MFAHDTEAALIATAALVNTLPTASDSGEDELADHAQLDAFVAAHAYTGSRTRDAAELEAVRALREPLRTFWAAPADRDEAVELVEAVNGLLRRYQAVPQLVRHDGWSWHVHAIDASAPLADRVAVEAALALVDLVRADELSRLRWCAAEDCGAVLVDLSRNRSKRFCDVGNCANRTHVAAYRARR